jgi:hypothetical protein
MKTLTIICRDTLGADVRRLLNDLRVEGYTVTPGLGGKGETGTVSEHSWTDRNISFMTAVDDQQAAAVTNAIKQLYQRLSQANHGGKVPLKVFLQPCEVIL